MTLYCGNCYILFDGKRCPVCGRKSARGPEPDDPCFLTEKEQLWGEMLADVLKQNGIPFIGKNVLGAGLSLKTGPMRERIRFYVPYGRLTEAGDIVEGLFSAPVEEE
ncbi:MAG: hypothetical protein IJS78_05895 [Clostridia bacterium]|nr:hypothetical protein [Clostridia bacterium]